MASSMSVLQLEQRRRKHGVSLESIADQTKISTRFLRAIESEEYEKLPGGVFNTSYIRQYASCIGFPEQKLLEHYNQRIQPVDAVDLQLLEQQADQRRAKANGFAYRWLSWFRSVAT